MHVKSQVTFVIYGFFPCSCVSFCSSFSKFVQLEKCLPPPHSPPLFFCFFFLGLLNGKYEECDALSLFCNIHFHEWNCPLLSIGAGNSGLRFS